VDPPWRQVEDDRSARDRPFSGAGKALLPLALTVAVAPGPSIVVSAPCDPVPPVFVGHATAALTRLCSPARRSRARAAPFPHRSHARRAHAPPTPAPPAPMPRRDSSSTTLLWG